MNVFDNIKATRHVVAESTRLKATHVGHIYDLKAIGDTDNGSIVARGDYLAKKNSTADRQLFAAKAYTAGAKPYLVLTTPIGYNSDRKFYQEECWFYNATGEIMRAYELYDDDEYTISSEGFTGSPAVGKYVSIVSGLYKVEASAPSSGFVGQIVDEIKYTNGTSYLIHVVSTGE